MTITSNGSSFVAQLPVGYDDATGYRYSIFVAMEGVPGYGPDVKELVFCLIEADESGDSLRQIWDGLDTRTIIASADDRAAILAATSQATKALVDEIAPRVITMVTHSANLPPKALAKYSFLVAMLAAEGFDVGKSDVWHGRHTWMMERRT